MTRRCYVGRLPVAIASLLIAGCNTYLQQKADVLGGGPEQRVRAAQERRQAAEDAQLGLQSDQEVLAEERALQEQELIDLNRQLQEQEARIVRARAENRITRTKEHTLRETIRSLDRDLHQIQLQLQAAQLLNDPRQEQVLATQLQTLKSKAETLDGEIDLLSE